MRSHWLILGVGFGVATLYLMIWAWQDIAFVSSRERLLRIGLLLASAFAGGSHSARAGSDRILILSLHAVPAAAMR